MKTQLFLLADSLVALTFVSGCKKSKKDPSPGNNNSASVTVPYASITKISGTTPQYR